MKHFNLISVLCSNKIVQEFSNAHPDSFGNNLIAFRVFIVWHSAMTLKGENISSEFDGDVQWKLIIFVIKLFTRGLDFYISFLYFISYFLQFYNPRYR